MLEAGNVIHKKRICVSLQYAINYCYEYLLTVTD